MIRDRNRETIGDALTELRELPATMVKPPMPSDSGIEAIAALCKALATAQAEAMTPVEPSSWQDDDWNTRVARLTGGAA